VSSRSSALAPRAIGLTNRALFCLIAQRRRAMARRWPNPRRQVTIGGRSPHLASSPSNPGHPIRIKRLILADTLSAVGFLKESLCSFIIEPAVHKRKTRLRFIHLKT
jgi:hypothetical protein